MISLSQVTQTIQDGLNAIGDREFVIYNDVGEFKKAYREDGSNTITRYVNGIMEALEPTLMPIKNLQIVTQSFRVTFVLDMDALSKDETTGNYIEVAQIRSILESYIASANAIPYSATADDISFEVTPSFSGVTVGVATQMSPIGNMLPMYLDFSCVFIQSGANTNTVSFIVNGEDMFFTDYSVTRVRTAETNMQANEPSQKTFIQANGISINLSLPMLNTAQSKAFEQDVWSGTQNQAVCVERYRANANSPYSCYIMVYGNNSESGGVGQNIGQVVDFVEGKQDVLNYGTGWSIQTFTGTSKTLTLPTTTKANVVYWGDGTSEHLAKTTTTKTHTYAENKTYTIRIFSY